ncbi:hypothetical protein D3C87_1598980 [compost metagenome]
MEIPEGCRRRLGSQTRLDDFGHISALLLGSRRDTGNRLSIVLFDRRCVTNDENVRIVCGRKIGTNNGTPRPVGLGTNPLCGGRCLHASRPDDRTARHEGFADRDPLLGNRSYRLPGSDFDAKLFQR